MTSLRKLQERGEYSLFYEALGQNLIAWQWVEKSLYEIFRSLVGAADQVLMSAAYHSITSVGARISMIDAVARHTLAASPALLKEWVELCNQVQKKKRLRDRIAHWEMQFTRSGGTPSPILTAQAFNVNVTKKFPNGNKPKYSQAELLKQRDEFRALAQTLYRFMKKFYRSHVNL